MNDVLSHCIKLFIEFIVVVYVVFDFSIQTISLSKIVSLPDIGYRRLLVSSTTKLKLFRVRLNPFCFNGNIGTEWVSEFRSNPTKNGQTHSNNSLTVCWRTVWVCWTILWGLSRKSLANLRACFSTKFYDISLFNTSRPVHFRKLYWNKN